MFRVSCRVLCDHYSAVVCWLCFVSSCAFAAVAAAAARARAVFFLWALLLFIPARCICPSSAPSLSAPSHFLSSLLYTLCSLILLTQFFRLGLSVSVPLVVHPQWWHRCSDGEDKADVTEAGTENIFPSPRKSRGAAVIALPAVSTVDDWHGLRLPPKAGQRNNLAGRGGGDAA